MPILESVEVKRKGVLETVDGERVVLIDQQGITLTNGAKIYGIEGGDLPVIAVTSALSQRFDATSTNMFILVVPSGSWIITGVVAVVEVVSGAGGTVTVHACDADDQVGEGTAQLTTPLVLSSGTNVAKNGVLVASPVVLTAGYKLSLVFAGTLTGVKGVITVEVKRLS